MKKLWYLPAYITALIGTQLMFDVWGWDICLLEFFVSKFFLGLSVWVLFCLVGFVFFIKAKS